MKHSRRQVGTKGNENIHSTPDTRHFTLFQVKSFYMFFLVAAVVFGMGCARGYESERPAGDLKVTLKSERYPLVKGDNVLMVKIADAAGKVVTDATVNVRYYMPPMPGMAPMDYNSQASLKGDTYSITANIPMEGGWRVEVSVTQPGRPIATATFNLDAR